MARKGQEEKRTTVKLTPMAISILERLGNVLGIDNQDIIEMALRDYADEWLTKPWLVYAQDGSVKLRGVNNETP